MKTENFILITSTQPFEAKLKDILTASEYLNNKGIVQINSSVDINISDFDQALDAKKIKIIGALKKNSAINIGYLSVTKISYNSQNGKIMFKVDDNANHVIGHMLESDKIDKDIRIDISNALMKLSAFPREVSIKTITSI